MLAIPPTKRWRTPHEMSKRPTPSFKQVAPAYIALAGSVAFVGALLGSCQVNEPAAQVSSPAAPLVTIQ